MYNLLMIEENPSQIRIMVNYIEKNLKILEYVILNIILKIALVY